YAKEDTQYAHQLWAHGVGSATQYPPYQQPAVRRHPAWFPEARLSSRKEARNRDCYLDSPNNELPTARSARRSRYGSPGESVRRPTSAALPARPHVARAWAAAAA